MTVISTGTQWNGEIYLKIDLSAALHFARDDGIVRVTRVSLIHYIKKGA
jgi:hypothetical protein